MSKYKAALYMRISNSDAKAGESESLANQRKLLMDFVAKNPDIEVVAEHLDDGVTGLVYDRPAFNELMKNIIDGKVNCAITKDLSRLGREYIDTGKYLREIFPKYGVRFIAVSDGIGTISETNLSEELGVTLKTLLNDAYSRDISKKTRSALISKRENGEFVGACPVYGYVRSEEQKNLLVPDVYASEVVKDIYKLRKDGMSAAKIAETLNKQGVLSPLAYKKDRGLPTPKGGFADKDGSMWSATTIIRILKDETYTGVLLQGKETTFNYKLKDKKHKPKDEWAITYDAHEPIIQRQDFDLVQKLMNIDTRTAPNEDSVHLFADVLICGCCGNRMTRKIVPYKDKKYYYYYCPTGRKNGCTAKMMKETDIVTCVATSVKTYIENVVDLDVLLETLGTKKIAKQITDKFMMQINDVDKQMQSINTFKIKLYESLVSEVLSKSEYNSYKKDYGMLADIEQDKIDCVACKDLSRMGRNSIDTGYYIEKYFPLHNVRFIAVTDDFDSDKDDGANGLMISLKNMINEAYSMDIGKKIKAQQEQAIKDGQFVGAKPPYGYKKSPSDCHKLIVNEDTAPIVKRIFEMASTGTGLTAICLALNAEKIPTAGKYNFDNGIDTSTRFNGIWNTRTIGKLLQSETYLGHLVQGRSTSFNRKQTQ